jgi:hypothetical protein
MLIPQCIQHIPTQINEAFDWTIHKGAQAKQGVADYWRIKCQDYSQSKFWQQIGKPFYERHIQPLNLIDYLLLSGGLATAILVTIVAVKILTVAVFPLAAAGGTLIVMGAFSLLRHKVRQHFNEMAWENIDQIRRIVHQMETTDPKFSEIIEERAQLMQPKFEYLKEDLKQLDKETNKFRKTALCVTTTPSVLEDSRQAFIAYLKGLQSKLASYRVIETLFPRVLTATDSNQQEPMRIVVEEQNQNTVGEESS